MYRRRLKVVRRSQRHQQKRLHYYRDDPVLDANWEAKTDYEYVQNYKLLQVAFTKNRVQKHIDVNKLIRGKYQDNLEFCQWLKAFYDQQGVGPRDGYDPLAIRVLGKGGKALDKKMSNTAKKPSRSFHQSSAQHSAAAAATRPSSRPMAASASSSTSSSSRMKKISKKCSCREQFVSERESHQWHQLRAKEAQHKYK